jgi:large subunit ribosomal protein L13
VKTYAVKAGEIDREWFVVDAEGKTLGRLASGIAQVLLGKHKPIFSPHLDTGDNVIVINADKIEVTGKKLDTIHYYHYSGYPGGLTDIDLKTQLLQHPERVVEAAVRGMLPKNRLGRAMIKKLHVYATKDHPHTAQQPKTLEL